MPFDANGVYTPPTGAENAAPGQVIRSGTWNSIFVDIASALTDLGQQSWVATPRTISSTGNITVGVSDSVIFIGASVPTIYMPLSATKDGPVRILGSASGQFASNNAKVVSVGSETFSGMGTITLSIDYQVIGFYPLTSGGYLVY